MAVNDLAVAAGQHRNLEAELTEAAAHPFNRGVVLAGIPGVQHQPIDVPCLNFEGLRRRDHPAPE